MRRLVLACLVASPCLAGLVLAELVLAEPVLAEPVLAEPVLADGDAAPTAAADRPFGVLEFAIVDAQGAAIPGRLTFVATSGETGDLFPNANADPEHLAVRKNVIYTLSGRGIVTVPVGEYDVYATRGIEWSLDTVKLAISADAPVAWTAHLKHEVDTTGWVSGDFHLHTLTYSGHGDSNMNERIISVVGEGVEFAVATDHNHNTDYDPTIEALGAGRELTAVTGNEVSVPVGHFNAFPLNPLREPVPSNIDDARKLFRLLRDETNVFDVVPVIQVNHPRWSGIDYFTIAGLDPVTGASNTPAYSDDFDAIEVLNENVGWGYHQPYVDGVNTDANTSSVVLDWYNLLNRGERYAAVGNSDSHTVHYAFAGYPRNFIRSSTDDPGAIDPAEIAREIRARHVYTTIGPVVDFSVDGTPMGGAVLATGTSVEVHVRVQAASWIDCDRVKIIVNGDIADVIDVPDSRDVVRLDIRRSVPIEHDSWVALLVEGDDPLDPVIAAHGRPIRPFAIVNPVWVDADQDGTWTSPWSRAVLAVEDAVLWGDIRTTYLGSGPTDRGLLTLAAAEWHRPFARDMVRAGLASREWLVRVRAARAAERLADPGLLDQLRAAARADFDPYTRVALLRAVAATDRSAVGAELIAFLRHERGRLPGRYLEELMPLLPGVSVAEWSVIGYFPAPKEGTVADTDFGPEGDADATRTYQGKDAAPLTWQRGRANKSGFLSLLGLAADPASAKNACAFAQTWLYSNADREVTVALGTDDGSRVYLNDELVYDNPARRGAKPFEHLAAWQLEEGWNRVLFKVENGSGSFGLYLRVLDDGVSAAAVPVPVPVPVP